MEMLKIYYHLMKECTFYVKRLRSNILCLLKATF